MAILLFTSVSVASAAEEMSANLSNTVKDSVTALLDRSSELDEIVGAFKV